ncbi:hypothetical protein ACJRO7_020124 [Eucalyptus globulus]|uniref:D-isomer specific 2-hydroxyacid dehydrogenase NAD-binding domain-containing protein n=1 Tax=Eucalyptus globulus TaxID=34317 RepID=A0ABD3KFI5_EUCGL
MVRGCQHSVSCKVYEVWWASLLSSSHGLLPQNDGALPPLGRRPPLCVLLLQHPLEFCLLDRPLSDSFRFLKPWKSPLPHDDSLSSADARLPEAILTSGRAPAWDRGCWHGDAYSEDVADLAVGLLIDVLRKVSASDRYVRRGLWSSGAEFALGSKVAKRLDAFGCAVSYNSRRTKPYVPFPFYSDVDELAQTHHMITREVLLALGKEGVIVNVGRGSIVDEKKMVQLLVQGELKGAGLDVFENEPDVPEELLALGNVVESLHTAVFTPESFSDVCDLTVGNLEAFFLNKPFLSPALDE